MKIESLPQIIFQYLKARIRATLLGATFIAVFIVVFLLYQTKLEPVLYAALLCVVIYIPVLIFDFLRFYKAHGALVKANKSKLLELTDLPQSSSLIERDYQELLEALYESNHNLLSQSDKQLTDMIDYYTLWVHQIKTPISALSLLIQVENHSQRRQLEAELFKIEQYVEMVLAYLRLSSNSTDYVIKSCDFDSIIKQALRKFSPLFIRSNIKLNYTPLHKTVITDEKWFLYTIEQLLSNALKYTPSGEISVYICDDTLVIEDNGMGISASDLPRVFERGFTGYNGRIDKKASGLGLYLCKKILTNLSHSIEIDSSPEKGTMVLVGLGRTYLQVE